MNKIMAESLPEKKTFIKLLSSIRSLPSMPVVMVEVSKLLSNPLTSAANSWKSN